MPCAGKDPKTNSVWTMYYKKGCIFLNSNFILHLVGFVALGHENHEQFSIIASHVFGVFKISYFSKHGIILKI